MPKPKTMNATQAIKKFFELGSEALAEIKKLSMDERRELGAQCCEALGVEFEPPKSTAKAA
jgi:hypothetical protein